MLYRNLSGYLKEKYGKKIGKICIDGGFSCPNRDGKCGTGGCIFCGERGSGEHLDAESSIRAQVERGLLSGRSDGYIAYFQNFTNTYAQISVLKERYDAALIDDRIVALAIGTRPDCIDEDVARLISSYGDRYDVWVELGVQTASDSTGRIINRGYDTDVFVRAVGILKKHGIPTVAHMIIGLPGEKQKEVDETVDLFNRLSLFGVKIHSLYVMKGTALAGMYERGEYLPLTFDEYVSLASRAIARLRPDTVLHRITGDCPPGMLIAPDWNSDKNSVIRAINATLEKNGQRQGSLYKQH